MNDEELVTLAGEALCATGRYGLCRQAVLDRYQGPDAEDLIQEVALTVEVKLREGALRSWSAVFGIARNVIRHARRKISSARKLREYLEKAYPTFIPEPDVSSRNVSEQEVEKERLLSITRSRLSPEEREFFDHFVSRGRYSCQELADEFRIEPGTAHQRVSRICKKWRIVYSEKVISVMRQLTSRIDPKLEDTLLALAFNDTEAAMEYRLFLVEVIRYVEEQEFKRLCERIPRTPLPPDDGGELVLHWDGIYAPHEAIDDRHADYNSRVSFHKFLDPCIQHLRDMELEIFSREAGGIFRYDDDTAIRKWMAVHDAMLSFFLTREARR